MTARLWVLLFVLFALMGVFVCLALCWQTQRTPDDPVTLVVQPSP